MHRDGSFTYESALTARSLAEDSGRVLMLDGGMSHANVSDYTLLDLDTLAAYAPA